MGVQDLSFREIKKGLTASMKKESLNSSVSSVSSPIKSQLNGTLKSLFSSFGLSTPDNLRRSGSSNALWFSSKFEKKMAALDEETPASPMTRFQRDVPLRESKFVGGPFKATQIWNEVIFHLKDRVEVKRRRHKLRNYNDCFTGTDAVDVVLHYLLSDQDTFCNLSREKAVKLCQSLMDKNVFEPVCAKAGETTKYQFEDSSSKLYRFSGEHSNKENETPNQSYVEEESVCQLEETRDNSDIEDDITHTPPEHLRLNPEIEPDLMDGAICNPSASSSPHSQILQDVYEKRRHDKRKHCDTSDHCSKRQKLSTSTESLSNADELSAECIEALRKETALCQLLTIIELHFLDGVLSEEKPKKLSKPVHGSVVSNMLAKHWNQQCLTNGPHKDRFMQAALDCIAYIPRGISRFDTDFTKACDPVTKLQAFNMISEYYAMRADPLFPERFVDLNMAVMNLVLQEKDLAAIQAMQLVMVLLADRQREELKRLLRFMAAAAEDNELQLDSQEDNEAVVLLSFTDSVVKHKGLAKNLSSILVTFFIHHVDEIFRTPNGFRERLNKRIEEEKKGKIPPVQDDAFCSQISSSEYQRQTEVCTNNELVKMMNSVIDNPKMTLKDKKQRLRQFRKYHPHIYAKHFSGMV